MPGPRRMPRRPSGKPINLDGQHQVLGNPELMRALGALREAVMAVPAEQSPQAIAELEAARARIAAFAKEN